MVEYLPILLFLVVFLVLLLGYSVALSLAGTSLIFAGVGLLTGTFDTSFLSAFPSRLFGIISNQTLIAVPLFVLMGVTLEKSRIAEDLLESMARLFGSLKGGLGVSVILVGMLLAASTGIVGATVVTMGLISLPTMLKRGYNPSFSTGIICATGTLGQIIPPSIALVLLGDVLSSAYQKAQLNMGVFSPKTVSVGDLFFGAVIPGLILVAMYLAYTLVIATLKPDLCPSAEDDTTQNNPGSMLKETLFSLAPPIFLIFTVLGSILGGFATPTEAAGVGAMGALLLALLKKQLSITSLREITQSTTQVTAMVFLILIGAALFSLVFRGFGGEELIQGIFTDMPGGVAGATLVVMLIIFLLGFMLDFIEITFVIVPIVGPI